MCTIKYMKTILITGACGFIGSHLCDYFINSHYNVIAIDNLSTGFMKNIEHLMEHKSFKFYYCDITNLDNLKKIFSDNKIDMISHQAALGSVPRSIDDPLSSHNNNVTGFLNILECCRINNIKRVVYASSSAVYGDSETLPKTEDKTGQVISPYGATKAIDEIYAHTYNKCYGMECIGLRYFNVFGERQNPDGCYAAVIPKFIKLIKEGNSPVINGDGTYSRDFTYIKNVVFGNFLALTKEYKSEVYNIGCEGQVTINEIVHEINKCLGTNILPVYQDVRQGDIPHSNASIDKAKKELGYFVKYDFKMGLKDLLH